MSSEYERQIAAHHQRNARIAEEARQTRSRESRHQLLRVALEEADARKRHEQAVAAENRLRRTLQPLVDVYREVERGNPEIANSPVHEVLVHRANGGLEAVLRWGNNFELSEGDAAIIADYRSGRMTGRKLISKNYPSSISEYEYRHIHGSVWFHPNRHLVITNMHGCWNDEPIADVILEPDKMWDHAIRGLELPLHEFSTLFREHDFHHAPIPPAIAGPM